MSDNDNKISLISEHRPSEGFYLKVKVEFKDGKEREFVCDYVAHSVEYPPMIALVEGEDDATPVAIINSDETRVLSVTKLPKEGLHSERVYQ